MRGDPVCDAPRTFAVRTTLSRGPLPLDHWPLPQQRPERNGPG
ncbi:hypothetical protein [Streptomyces boncukensis]|nr:hypothetical protein [Streptomyces boncukensis]